MERFHTWRDIVYWAGILQPVAKRDFIQRIRLSYFLTPYYKSWIHFRQGITQGFLNKHQVCNQASMTLQISMLPKGSFIYVQIGSKWPCGFLVRLIRAAHMILKRLSGIERKGLLFQSHSASLVSGLCLVLHLNNFHLNKYELQYPTQPMDHSGAVSREQNCRPFFVNSG